MRARIEKMDKLIWNLSNPIFGLFMGDSDINSEYDLKNIHIN